MPGPKGSHLFQEKVPKGIMGNGGSLSLIEDLDVSAA